MTESENTPYFRVGDKIVLLLYFQHIAYYRFILGNKSYICEKQLNLCTNERKIYS